MMNAWKLGRRAFALAAVVMVSACGGGSSNDTASVRLLNATEAYASLDLVVDDTVVNSAVAYGSVGSYASVATGSLTHIIRPAGETGSLNSSSRSLTAGADYTVIAYGVNGSVKTALLTENESAAATNKSKLMVVDEATDAGSLDVYLTGASDSLDSATAISSSLTYGSSAGYLTLTSGTYRLRVTAAGDKSDLRLDVSGLTLTSTGVSTLLLTSGSGGTLVHGMHIVQQGSLTKLLNTQARARVVASVAGNGVVTASLGGTTLGSSVTSPSIGSYVNIPAGTDEIGLTVNGTRYTYASSAVAAGADITMLVTGSATAPTVSVISDDNHLPTASTAAKVRLVHGVSNLASTVSLTVDYSAVASNITAANASSFANVTASADMLLDVTSPIQTTSLYSSGATTTLTAKGVYTLFMLGDYTGTGVRAVLRKDR